MRKIILFITILISWTSYGQRAIDVNKATVRNWIIYQGDTLAVTSISGDTIFVTKGATLDMLLTKSYWTATGNDIQNNNAGNTTIDSALRVPRPYMDSKVGYVMGWMPGTGNQYPITLGLLRDTLDRDENDERATNTKWIIFGDSFSYVTNGLWPVKVIDTLRLVGTETDAAPGNTMKNQLDTLISRLAGDATYLDDFTILTLLVGINDFAGGTLGTINDAVGAATYTGYLKQFILTAAGANPDLRIMIMTPLPSFKVSYNRPNANLFTVEDMAFRCAQVADLYNVECIDTYHLSGINDSTYLTYLGADTLHPSAAGYTMIGKIVTDAFLNDHNKGQTANYHTMDATGGSVAIGYQSLKSNTDYTIGIGRLAGYGQTTGLSNTYVGYNSGYINSTSSYNTGFGYHSLFYNSAANNTAVGYKALFGATGASTGAQNAAVGSLALTKNESGASNVAVGYNTLSKNTTGSYNVAIGGAAGSNITTGSALTAVGFNSLLSSTAASTAVGYGSGQNNSSGVSNTYIGQNAGLSTTTSGYNTYIGHNAGFYMTSSNNLGIGYRSLFGVSGSSTGGFNVALGESTLEKITTGLRNVAVGYFAGYNIATGTDNVMLGYRAGYNETASDKLYIANDSTSAANFVTNDGVLIYGDFDNQYINIFNKVAIGVNKTPAYTLDVAGDGYFSDDLVVNDTLRFTGSGNIVTTGNGDLNLNTGSGAVTMTGDLEVSGYPTFADYYHSFGWFGDSTSAFSFANSNTWYHLTNAGQELWTWDELDGFTLSNDTITVTKAGDYDISLQLSFLGSANQSYSVRFYNVTQAAGIPVAGATEGAGTDVSQVVVLTYGELTAGDKIVIQMKNVDGTGAATLKNSAVRMIYIHD